MVHITVGATGEVEAGAHPAIAAQPPMHGARAPGTGDGDMTNTVHHPEPEILWQ